MIELNLIKKIETLLYSHLNQSLELLKLISGKIGKCQNAEQPEPFNIILAASDTYYRENYHSYIITYILSNRNNTFRYFLNYLDALSDLPKLDINNYSDFVVVREESKIDILIKDEESRHCIIIENKINNAGDMERQLPRYFELLKSDNYIIDRILYFSFDGKKRPEKVTWTDSDLKLGLDDIIVYGAAANGTEKDFVNSFLIPCKDNAKNEQEKSFYKQYVDLLEYLRRDYMDYQLMEKFYKEMLNKEQYNTALSVRTMVNDLIVFRRDRLHNNFINNYKPFESVFKWSHNDTGFVNIREISSKERIKIDIWVEQDKYVFYFWIQEPKVKTDLIKTILEKIGEDKEFTKEDQNSYFKEFAFPDEENILYSYVAKFLDLLNKHKDSIKL